MKDGGITRWRRKERTNERWADAWLTHREQRRAFRGGGNCQSDLVHVTERTRLENCHRLAVGVLTLFCSVLDRIESYFIPSRRVFLHFRSNGSYLCRKLIWKRSHIASRCFGRDLLPKKLTLFTFIGGGVLGLVTPLGSSIRAHFASTRFREVGVSQE